MKEIDWLRENIDKIDKQLLTLFLERMETVRGVGEYKKERDLPVYDPKRELDILEDKVKSLTDPQMRSYAISFFTELMDLSKDYQNEIIGKRQPKYNGEPATVSYCGAPGAFAHEAALAYFGEQPMKALSSFSNVVEDVLSGNSQYGVLPIENSSQGSVLEVYDLLGENDVFIVAEHYLPVRHCLVGMAGLEQVETVVSHPQALRQCSRFIGEQGFAMMESSNTALAAQRVAEKNDPTLAAIASRHAAEMYGLRILGEDISDSARNFTRFIVIGREQEHKQDYEKVSLTFALPHREGSLLAVLEKFAHLNLTKIESRPSGKWEYLFYLDFEGGRIDGMIEGIEHMKILGTYLKGDKRL